MTLKISLITVCYNSEKTIAQTIQSVVEQDYANKEYVIIDGASADNTVPIIQSHAASIDEWRSEPDHGIYHAMNKGILLATGDVIGLINADDQYVHPQVLSKVARVFEDPQVHACYGDLVYFSEHNPDKIIRYWKSMSYKPGLFAKGWCPPHPTFFVRKSVYDKYGFFDLNYKMGNDVELMMRFLEKYHINSVHIPEVLVKMRSGGVSNRSLKNIFLQNREVMMAAKKLHIPLSPFVFLMHKCMYRLPQFWRVPQEKS